MSRNSSFDSPRLLPGSSPLPAPQLSTGPALIPGGRAGRRGSASISSVNSSFSGVFGSGVAGSIGSAVDGSGQRQLLSDKYVLGEELGRGAFGQVYKGMDTRSGESVAIKQMSLGGIASESLAGIMSEIELLRNLHHPNIVEYIGSFKTRSHLYIIMEFMENGALSSVIKPNKFGPFPEPLAAAYISQVLRGLSYLHDQGVVHRDIKGANILTTKDGLVKLADFGVAARLSESPDGDELSLSVVGTPYWMAPEVIEMTSVSSASDIWSVGCLAIELLTGSPPYSELQPMSALFRVVQDEHPPLPPHISQQMQNFLLQCFQKNPYNRPDARALLRHPWIESNQQSLQSTWRDTRNAREGTSRTEAHTSVAAVVEHILQSTTPVSEHFRAASSRFPASSAGQALPIGRSISTPLPSPSPRSQAPLPSPPVQTQPQPPNGSLTKASSAGVPRKRPPALQLPSDAESPLEVLLGRLDDSASALHSNGVPSSDPHPEVSPVNDLASWLAERDLNAPAPRDSPTASMDGDDTGMKRHEIRQLVAALRVSLALRPVAQESPMGAAATLSEGMRGSPRRKAIFLSEDGAVAIIELLSSRKPEVVLGALRLTNAVAAGDPAALLCLTMAGVLPAVACFSDRCYDYPLREQASIFLQHVCYTSPSCIQMLVACQGLHHLVELVDDMYSDGGALSDAGVCCIWRTLEVSEAAALNQRCRLLAAAGLPSRLVALCARARVDWLAVREQMPPGTAQAAERDLVTIRQSSSVSEELLSADEMLSTDDYFGRRKGSYGNGSGLLNGTRLNPPQTAAGRQPPASGKNSSVPSPVPESVERLPGLMARAADLLLVLAHADTVVKAAIARRDTLLPLLEMVTDLRADIAVKLLCCVKHLSRDPSMLLPLYDCGTIQLLEPFLRPEHGAAVQLEALAALYNLCKISKTRQEAAAVAGVVPHLARLAAPTSLVSEAAALDNALAARLRDLAVPLLCSMAHSTGRARAALAAADGAAVLLSLLPERAWQAPALDALATWLVEDTTRLEPRLLPRDVTNRFVSLLGAYTPCAPNDTEALLQLLGPLVRMARCSPRLAVALGSSGLPPLLVQLLRAPPALTALPLLQLLRSIYEHHPRPKDFLVKWGVHVELRLLASSATQAVLVRKQAQTLLDAFRVNGVF